MVGVMLLVFNSIHVQAQQKSKKVAAKKVTPVKQASVKVQSSQAKLIPIPPPIPASGKSAKPAAPSTISSMSMPENPVKAEKEVVYTPRPNMSRTFIEEALPRLVEVQHGALINPLVVLPPDGDEKQMEIFFRAVKSLGDFSTTRVNPVLVKSINGKETIAVVLNSRQLIETFISTKEVFDIPCYVFLGLDEVAKSTDPYIRMLNEKKSLFKLIDLQNNGYLPTQAIPSGGENQLNSQ